MRTFSTRAPRGALLFLLIALLSGGCSHPSSESDGAAFDWRPLGETGERYRLLDAPRFDAANATLSLPLELDAAGRVSRRELRLRAGDAHAVVEWHDAEGLAWAYELEADASGFVLHERAGSDALRMEVREVDGRISERYAAGSHEVELEWDAAHDPSCAFDGPVAGCAFAADHSNVAWAELELLELASRLPALDRNQEGLRVTRLLGEASLRDVLRAAQPEPLWRTRRTEQVCKWAERGTLKCAVLAWSNPICHVAVGTTVACLIAEALGE